jgi:hypothetical protein
MTTDKAISNLKSHLRNVENRAEELRNASLHITDVFYQSQCHQIANDLKREVEAMKQQIRVLEQQ